MKSIIKQFLGCIGRKEKNRMFEITELENIDSIESRLELTLNDILYYQRIYGNKEYTDKIRPVIQNIQDSLNILEDIKNTLNAKI